MTEPVPFEIYEEGVYLHGTRAVNHTDQRLPGNPTRSYRTLDPVRERRRVGPDPVCDPVLC
ncbi:hypothetical protein CFK38_04610 [Brachybacterium vulturis]|uniref:Rifampin ADP-ribosyltransferase domain-containing protein n=1 Tax=Brachybacterium vulturis TaxID=2017484 RepID=A0A291GL06_9MICO|nr:NAD(+)--rifampin ADP-ribosyltransferase [Brachybacterium vulturis]ATG50887.1 hypothetical protein CFK38_04610 [Brachybacterium vulturis]